LNLTDAKYVREDLRFPGCQILLRVDRDVTDIDGRVTLSATRYFVTSTDPQYITADQLIAKVRRHWQIENCIFHIKDCWWFEDRHWTKRPGLSEWLANLTTSAIIVLRLLANSDSHKPIRARADDVQWRPRIGLKLLGLT